jgi:hypothetical protein
MSDVLSYRSNVGVEELGIGECTVHRASNSSGARWWLLWFHVIRDDGQPDDFAVPLNPNGAFIEAGPGGKTWGITRTTTPGVWQIAPSINVLGTRETHAGPHSEASLWHKTPSVIGVPDGDAWTLGAQP